MSEKRHLYKGGLIKDIMINTIKTYIKKKNQFIDIRRLNFGIKHYTPKRNKVKCWALFGFIGLLFATPCTNRLLIPLNKILNKCPLWIYK